MLNSTSITSICFCRYCKREHQKAAWDRGYKEECAALVAWAPKVPPATLRLAARASWRARCEAQAANGTSKNAHVAAPFSSWEDASGLVSHWESLEPARKALYAGMAAAARYGTGCMMGSCMHSTALCAACVGVGTITAVRQHHVC